MSGTEHEGPGLPTWVWRPTDPDNRRRGRQLQISAWCILAHNMSHLCTLAPAYFPIIATFQHICGRKCAQVAHFGLQHLAPRGAVRYNLVSRATRARPRTSTPGTPK